MSPTPRYYIINTDAKSLGNVSPDNIWLASGHAFTGGDYIKYGRRVLGKLTPGDVLIMYANKTGGVAIGEVIETWDGNTTSSGQLVYHHPYLFDEYKIRINWKTDLRNCPILPATLRNCINNAPLNHVLIEIKNIECISNIINSMSKCKGV